METSICSHDSFPLYFASAPCITSPNFAGALILPNSINAKLAKPATGSIYPQMQRKKSKILPMPPSYHTSEPMWYLAGIQLHPHILYQVESSGQALRGLIST